MTLATADAEGVPSARVVLLRGLDASGLTWYTNRTSLKGRDLAANPRAALVFHWERQQRQVRVTGTVAEVPEAEAVEDALASAIRIRDAAREAGLEF